jgi:choline transport protein
MITSLIMFNKESYVPERWHTSLLMIGTMVVPLLCNLWFRKVLSSIETLAGVLHICLFIVYIAVLASGGTRNDNDFVFKTLTHDVSGWSNPGVAFCLGLLSATFSLSGVDSIIHMSTYHAHHLVLFSFATPTDSLPTGDEVKNVRTDVPRSIIVACTTNSIMLATFVLVLLFFMGPADDDLTTAPLPLIYVLYNATGSKPATNLLVALVAVVCYCATFNCFASVSRLVWAFARDNGLPFSGFFGYVHPRLHVPTNALLLVGLMVVLLSLIYIGSVTAFNAIISLQTLGVYASYILPISFLLLRKLRGPEPPYGPFKMGAWGVPVNVFALCYLLFIVTWMPFPSVLPVSSNNMNYAGPIFGGIVLLALGDWFLNGRKRFQMPVKVYE